VTVRFVLARGGTAELVDTDGNLVTLLSNASAPPGTPLDAELDGTRYRIKVRSCRKTDEHAELPFRIEGRFQNLTKAARERLERAG
jgi:hypothetical protein